MEEPYWRLPVGTVGSRRRWHLLFGPVRAVCGLAPLNGWGTTDPPDNEVVPLCARCEDFELHRLFHPDSR